MRMDGGNAKITSRWVHMFKQLLLEQFCGNCEYGFLMLNFHLLDCAGEHLARFLSFAVFDAYLFDLIDVHIMEKYWKTSTLQLTAI